jgi:hypothetical protein
MRNYLRQVACATHRPPLDDPPTDMMRAACIDRPVHGTDHQRVVTIFRSHFDLLTLSIIEGMDPLLDGTMQ